MFSTNIASCVIGVGAKKQYDPPMNFLKSKVSLFFGKNFFLHNTGEQN